ncbi:hypothetical protein [Rufibacter sp. LB8]|uniref:hypothetical protein n=1 Tax=Rufibacter sp. LB8 TaxID=2777781 RepID=UPI00178C613B|nr:hypothetical protein [Rufibacter sp. LB8]
MATAQDLKNGAQDLKNAADNYNPEHREGPVARTIEEYTAKLPSDLFLWAALGSMAVSATLKIMKKDEEALFVGQWPAPFLLLGLYNKIVKVKGHEGEKTGGSRNGGGL